MYAIETVFYPLLCKKKEDTIHLKESYELLIRTSTFIAFPILIILMSLGKPIVIILLSEKWLGSLQILKLISIAYLFVPIIYINNSFLKIINKPNVLYQSGLLKKAIGLVILIISINYDIEYVMYGIILYNFIDSFISMIITQVLLKISVIKQLGFILNNILLNIILLFLMNYTSSFFNNVFIEVFVSIGIGVFFYLGIPMILKLKEFVILKNILYQK